MQMFDNLKRAAGLAGSALIVAALVGCAAASVSLAKKDLVVQTKTSTAVFVDPVAPADRTLYVEVRSGVQEFDRRAFSKYIKQEFSTNENGYRIVDDPTKARYQMLAYVLNLEESNPTAAEAALHQGYVGGDVMAGAVAGGVIGANSHGRLGGYGGAAVGGLLAGGVSMVANSLVHDVTFVLVCDVSIRERAAPGVLVRKDTAITAKVSDGGTSQQRVSEVSDKKEYRTRIVTTANKANLKLEEAQDSMFSKTAYAMSGFF
ncbi:MAG: complement resistance protein TraT [Burkholderiaceae bacterium]